jgi:hypothetical protein
MATFNPVVRTKDKEFNTVYIRIGHNSRTDYIKTSMSLHKSGIKKGEIVYHTILANCYIKIKSYINKLKIFLLVILVALILSLTAKYQLNMILQILINPI